MELSKFLEILPFKENNVIELLSYYLSNMIGKPVKSYHIDISYYTHGRFCGCASTDAENIYVNSGRSMYLLLELKMNPYTN